MTLISIVVPFIDELAAAKMTAESVDTDDVEMIFICGSSKLSEAAVRKFLGNNSIIRFEKPEGIYSAMNKGAMAASSPYLFFCGAGDTLIRRGLRRLLMKIKLNCYEPTSPIVMPVYLSSSKRFAHPKTKCTPIIAHHQGYLFPRKSFLDGKLFNESFILHGDWDLMAKLSSVLRTQKFHLAICKFESGGRSTSGNNCMTTLREMLLTTVAFGSRYRPSVQHVLNLIRPFVYKMRAVFQRPRKLK